MAMTATFIVIGLLYVTIIGLDVLIWHRICARYGEQWWIR
jgi:hypothetical protein